MGGIMARILLAPAVVSMSCLLVAACGIPEFVEESLQSHHRASPSNTSRRPPAVTAQRAQVRPDDSSAPNRAESTAIREGGDSAAPPVNLVGLGEQQLRELLGPPASEEERPPGKLWRYGKGGCNLNVSLYPDVQSRKFGTLTYEVKTNDDTDEGKRACLAELQSRGRSR
jgi:hypothetical protein